MFGIAIASIVICGTVIFLFPKKYTFWWEGYVPEKLRPRTPAPVVEEKVS
jgi:hypothetical protein